MNKSQTGNDSGTKLTQPDSRPVRKGVQAWIVRDGDDKPWGPFADAAAAGRWAQAKWPEDPDSWDVEGLWDPTQF